MTSMAEGNGAVQHSHRELTARYQSLPKEAKAKFNMLLEKSEEAKNPDTSTAVSTIVKIRPTRRGPLNTFTCFKRLPREIRTMIWAYAMPDIVEAIPEKTRQSFITRGPRHAIFDICYNAPHIFHMIPIYLPKEPTPIGDPVFNIWLRPTKDILYLNTEALYNLDIPHFLAIEPNQVLQTLAIPAIHDIRWCGTENGRVPGTTTWLGKLVRGLRNLKTLYIVEGHTLYTENEVKYWHRDGSLHQHDLQLKDCRSAYETRNWGSPSQRYSKPAKPWNQETAVDVMEMFKDEVSRENSGKFPVAYPLALTPPEIICKEVKRLPWGCRIL